MLFSQDAGKVIPNINFKVESVENEEQSVKLPLVKHGTDLDSLPLGSELGIIGGEATDIAAHPYQVCSYNH